ncbi:SRPBCC family protein [Arthrobacter globiformis]|uniref:SRPBCC family protein n=1 Tax=Arthrobacter globiformis TaxID=1665 RepID=UPI00397D9326
MAHAENEVTINRPASEVYAFLADGLNNPKWRSGVQSIALKEGVAGETGAVYSQTLTGPKGRPLQGDYRVTDAQPGRLLGFQVVAGPARPVGSYALTESGDGTRVHFSLDLKLPILMRVLDSLVTKTMESEVAQLHKLKEVLEAR